MWWLLFSLRSWCAETLCVPSKSEVSVLSSPVELLQSNPTEFQSQILWGLLLPLKDHPLPQPPARKPDMVLKTLIPVGELLWYNCFPDCVLPSWWVWDLILLWLCLSCSFIVAFSLSLEVGHLFWYVLVFFLVSSYSAVSCDPCVLIRRGERTSPFKKDIHLVHGWKARGSFWGPYTEAGSSSLAYRLFFQTTWFHGLRLAWLPLGSSCHCFIVGEADMLTFGQTLEVQAPCQYKESWWLKAIIG